jgi:RNA polymerase sigma factor (sigma-70 family)
MDPSQPNLPAIFPSDFVNWQSLDKGSPSQSLITSAEKQLIQSLQKVSPISAIQEYQDDDPITERRRVVDLWAKLFLTYLRAESKEDVQQILLEHLEAVRAILAKMHNHLLSIAEDDTILFDFLEHPQESSNKFLSCFLQRLGCLTIQRAISSRAEFSQNLDLTDLGTLLLEVALNPSNTLQKFSFNYSQSPNTSTKKVSPLGPTIESFARIVLSRTVENYFKKNDYAAQVRSMTATNAIRRIPQKKMREALTQCPPLTAQSSIDDWQKQMYDSSNLLDFTFELIKAYRKYYRDLYQGKLIGETAKANRHQEICQKILSYYQARYPSVVVPTLEALGQYLEDCGLHCKEYHGKSLTCQSLEKLEPRDKSTIEESEDLDFQRNYEPGDSLKSALDKIGEALRHIIFLRCSIGLSEQMIADILNCSQATINRRIRRVIQQCLQGIIEAEVGIEVEVGIEDERLKRYKPYFAEYFQQYYDTIILKIATRRLGKIISDPIRRKHFLDLIYTQTEGSIQELTEIKELKEYLSHLLTGWIDLYLKPKYEKIPKETIIHLTNMAIERQLEGQYAFLIHQLQY